LIVAAAAAKKNWLALTNLSYNCRLMDLLQVFWSLLETQLQRSMLNEEKDLEKK
jgi:hypothetical protein